MVINECRNARTTLCESEEEMKETVTKELMELEPFENSDRVTAWELVGRGYDTIHTESD